MKLLISLAITIALAASLLAQTPSPTPSVAEEQARQELNEAARAYNTRYRMPKERVEFERAKECADHALELVNMAIALTPEDVSSWSYKTNILLELEKLAEMSGDVRLKRELHRQHEEALSETTKLSKPSESKP